MGLPHNHRFLLHLSELNPQLESLVFFLSPYTEDKQKQDTKAIRHVLAKVDLSGILNKLSKIAYGGRIKLSRR
jgi:hypothetical protein